MSMLSKFVLGSTLLSSSVAVLAADPISLSANVAMTSDYILHGVSQTMDDPAIQGGFDLKHNSGAYAGIWGSNVRYAAEGDSYDGAHLEVDVYAGYAGEINDFSYDLGYAHYFYPGTTDYEFGELYAKGTFSMVTLTYKYAPSFPSYDNDPEDDNAHYLNLGVAYELPEGFTLGAGLGWSYYPDTVGDADDDYVDWSLSLSKSLMGVDVTLAYTDTDLDNNKRADSRAVLTVAKTF